MGWSATVEPVSPTRRATRHAITSAAGPVSRGQALEMLESDPLFASFLTGQLARAAASAYRWETPPVTRASLARPFEFVIVDDPSLEMTPEPEVFAGYFARNDDPVMAVPNLGRTATMVVPRQLAEASAYAHLASFVRRAPPEQVASFWRCVARTALDRLDHAPLWLSTAGGGVAWLHARIERVPKYYAYRPYTRPQA